MSTSAASLRVVACASIDISSVAPTFCWVQAVIPLGLNESVAFVYEGEETYFLIHVAGNDSTVYPMPQRIMLELTGSFGNFSARLCACKVDGRFGVLVGDRALYLFTSFDNEPERYAIENPFNTPGDDAAKPFVSVRAGVGRDSRVPVIFRHQNLLDSQPYYSLLEIDNDRKSAQWIHRTATDLPLKTRDVAGGGMGSTEVWDIAWTGNDYRVFSIGNSASYRRYGMSNSSLLSCDTEGGVNANELDIDENCFGEFASNCEHLIVSPLRERGERRGKQSIVSLQSRVETTLKLPRGFTKFKLHDVFEGRYWFSNNTQWPQKGPLQIASCELT